MGGIPTNHREWSIRVKPSFPSASKSPLKEACLPARKNQTAQQTSGDAFGFKLETLPVASKTLKHLATFVGALAPHLQGTDWEENSLHVPGRNIFNPILVQALPSLKR